MATRVATSERVAHFAIRWIFFSWREQRYKPASGCYREGR